MQRNSAETLPKLVGLSDYCPLLLLHMGANDTARGNLNSIRRDYRALGGRDSQGYGGPSSVLSSASEMKGYEEESTWLQN